MGTGGVRAVALAMGCRSSTQSAQGADTIGHDDFLVVAEIALGEGLRSDQPVRMFG
jgi:hypothetical protein